MVQVAITTDLHFKGDKLTDLTKAWEQTIDYCITNSIPNLIILGDIFEHSNISTHRVSVGTITKAFLEPLLQYATFIEKTFPNVGMIYVLEGNHDQSGASQDSSLQFLRGIRKNIKLVDLPEIVTIDNKLIGMLPWISQKQVKDSDFTVGVQKVVSNVLTEFKSKNVDYLMGHVRVDGYDLSGYKMVGGHYSIKLADLLSVTKNLYFGDIHKPDDYYVGSLIQNSFGDVDNFQGFIVLDTETNTKTRVSVSSPEYKVIKIKTIEDLPISFSDVDYFRLDVDSKIDISLLAPILKYSNVKTKTVSDKEESNTLESLNIVNLDELSLFKEWLVSTEFTDDKKQSLIKKVEGLRNEIN